MTTPGRVRRISVPSRDHRPRRVAVFRFPLGQRMVEELWPAAASPSATKPCGSGRGKFDEPFANQIRRRLPRVDDSWPGHTI